MIKCGDVAKDEMETVMTDRLAGKVAVITGAASGIGAAVARIFVEEGAAVVATDIQNPVDRELADVIARRPDRIRFRHCDVTQESEVRSAVGEAVETWGKVTTAVASAGIVGLGRDIDLTEQAWDRILSINAKGVFLLTKYAVPEIIAAGGGAVVNISSAYGLIGAPGFAAYCASKGAVRLLTKATAVEHAASGVRANSIHPFMIETPMLEALFEESGDVEAARERFGTQHPSGFNGAPSDVGWACVYLASDESRFVNGVELPIDGGRLAG